MLRIACPFCGPRDEIEFRFRGDATVARPPADGSTEAFLAYVYERENPDGWHVEWWQHVFGCRRILRVERHVTSHEIRAVAWARPE
jgi:heterotetrameric sarcosine oxidase delta subunit